MDQMRSAMMVMSHLAPAQEGKVRFDAIRASVFYTMALDMVDPLHGETSMQRFPDNHFFRVHNGP